VPDVAQLPAVLENRVVIELDVGLARIAEVIGRICEDTHTLLHDLPPLVWWTASRCSVLSKAE